MAFEEDMTGFFDDFGYVATLETLGRDIRVIPYMPNDNRDLGGIHANVNEFSVTASSQDIAGIATGETVVLEGKTYDVIWPPIYDGTGLVNINLVLTQQSQPTQGNWR